MVDSVGLVHMNGRVYDPELGRFLSADPHVQDATNLQSWNRYAYVLNNPLSYTDPTGFFFSKLFKSIGRAIGNFFKAVGRVLKKALQNPIIRGIIQIIGCAVTAAATAGAGCVAITAGLTLAAGGSIADALQAGAFSLASMGVFAVAGQVVDLVTSGLQLAGAAADVAFTAIKAGIHGIAGGALSVAQGGSFSEGFIASAIGAVGGQLSQGAFGRYGTGDLGNALGRAAISAIAGCGGAVLSGGKCANGAVTAAFASLFNGDSCLTVAAVACMAGGAAGAKAVGAGACVAGGPGCPLTGAGGAVAGGVLGCVAAGGAAAYTCNKAVHGNSYASKRDTEVYYLINRGSGAIDKIGITSNPSSRYPQSYLKSQNVFYQMQTRYSSRYPAVVDENIRLVHYRIKNGRPPRLNRVDR